MRAVRALRPSPASRREARPRRASSPSPSLAPWAFGAPVSRAPCAPWPPARSRPPRSSLGAGALRGGVSRCPRCRCGRSSRFLAPRPRPARAAARRRARPRRARLRTPCGTRPTRPAAAVLGARAPGRSRSTRDTTLRPWRSWPVSPSSPSSPPRVLARPRPAGARGGRVVAAAGSSSPPTRSSPGPGSARCSTGRSRVPTVSPFGPFVNKNHFAGWTAMARSSRRASRSASPARREGARSGDWTAGPRRGRRSSSRSWRRSPWPSPSLASLSRGGAFALAAGAACLRGARPRPGPRTRAARRASCRRSPSPASSAVLLARPRAARGAGAHAHPLRRLLPPRHLARLAAARGVEPGASGSGLGAFHDAYPRFKRGYGVVRVEHAENDYVETLAETGRRPASPSRSRASVLLLAAAASRRSPADGDRARARDRHAARSRRWPRSPSTRLVDFNLRIPSNAALAALAAAAAAGLAGARARPLAARRRAAPSRWAPSACSSRASLPAARSRGRPAREEAAPRRPRPWPPTSARLRLERAGGRPGAQLLRRRPAHAESWLMLAGVRAARATRPPAAALARHAVSLDPERPACARRPARPAAISP